MIREVLSVFLTDLFHPLGYGTVVLVTEIGGDFFLCLFTNREQKDFPVGLGKCMQELHGHAENVIDVAYHLLHSEKPGDRPVMRRSPLKGILFDGFSVKTKS